MRVTTRSVKTLAQDAGLPDELIERHIDELCTFVFSVATRERNSCQDKIRAWFFSKDITKPNLIDVLRSEDDDYELM